VPDYLSDAPFVDLFSVDEELVLSTWFEIDRPPHGCRVDDIFDGWNISGETPDYRRIDTAVAQILLERIQDDLPNWTALAGDRFVSARGNFDRRARRKNRAVASSLADNQLGRQWARLLLAGRL